MTEHVLDPRLAEWGSTRQAEILAAVNAAGNYRSAADALGINRSNVSRSMAALKMSAAVRGYSPEHQMTKPVSPVHVASGVSTLYDEDGKVRMQWVKSSLDKAAQLEVLKEFAADLAEGVKGLAPMTPPPANIDDDILCVYPMGDPHFGMYAWWQDTGNNFDLDIAESLTNGAIDRLVSSAPAGGTAVLLNLGDMFHADSQMNTTQSGHQLDVDGRWKKVQQVGLRSMIHCVRRLLERHSKVIFRINGGNHDGHSSYALSMMLDCYFHNEPRVQVELSPSDFWYYEFGSNLIGSTHGDKCKGSNLLGVMAADQAEAWGRTKHRQWYVGHVHHQEVKEYPGGVVEYFRTLAARDAWHAGQGYRAGRDMRLIVLHRQHGEVERHRCDVGMLKIA